MACNAVSGRFGLTLTEKQIENLTRARFQALRASGRVEFGEGVLEKLVYAFCDSPYIDRQTYEQTLEALQELFYYFKNESRDSISDDELIQAMSETFNGRAQGSLDYLAGCSPEMLLLGGRDKDDDIENDDGELW